MLMQQCCQSLAASSLLVESNTNQPLLQEAPEEQSFSLILKTSSDQEALALHQIQTLVFSQASFQCCFGEYHPDSWCSLLYSAFSQPLKTETNDSFNYRQGSQRKNHLQSTLYTICKHQVALDNRSSTPMPSVLGWIPLPLVAYAGVNCKLGLQGQMNTRK